MTVTGLLPIEITIGKRFRKELGDIEGLAEDIAINGLIQPIAVDPDGVLLAGMRRLTAWRSRWPDKPIPVRVMPHQDLLGALRVEQSENTCRLPMVPSEMAALAAAMLEVEKQNADQRRQAGNARGGRANSHRPSADGEVEVVCAPDLKQKSTEAVAAALGTGRTSMLAAIEVVKTAQTDLDPALRAIAEREVIEMDRTGKVAGPARRVRTAKRRGRRPTSKVPVQPHGRPEEDGDATPAIQRRVDAITAACSSLARVTAEQVDGIDSALSQEWIDQLEECQDGLKEFVALIDDRIGD